MSGEDRKPLDWSDDGRPRTVAFFGGSFNPPHISHVLSVVYALSVFPIDLVMVVPVFQHPFAKELAAFDDRMEMCRVALSWIPGVMVSAVERELGGESLTLRTLEHLRGVYPHWSFRLLVGADVLADLHKWHRFDRIAEIAPPIVLGRAGVQANEAPEPLLPRVSSTEIREAAARGRLDEVKEKIPERVRELIVSRGIYSRKS